MKEFAGQWLGQFTGTNHGLALLDLDLEDGFLKGMVYAFESDQNIPSTCATLKVEPLDDRLEFEVTPAPLSQKEAQLLSAGEFEGTLPNKLSVRLKRSGNTMKGQWFTDIETSGEIECKKSEADKKTSIEAEDGTITWEEFQSKVTELVTSPYRFIFRGQSSAWRLRTSFHRSNRKDLWRYWNEDIPRIRHASIGAVDQIFDPNIAEHNGAFMHLLQHHGYPTPMLDWTYSPYIAAFFAFSSAFKTQSENDPIRIFMFDAEQWKSDYNQLWNVTLCRPHFSLIEPLALGNPRALPQKSMAAITNLDDIEEYILQRQRQKDRIYLRAFDIDPRNRKQALRQLGLMGISPGSMFPGIEGVCKEYKDRDFGY